MRGNIIKGHLHFIHNVTKGDLTEYNSKTGWHMLLLRFHVESSVWCKHPSLNYGRSNNCLIKNLFQDNNVPKTCQCSTDSFLYSRFSPYL